MGFCARAGVGLGGRWISGEYSGFDPELKALSEKAARFVVMKESMHKLEEKWDSYAEERVANSPVAAYHKKVEKLADSLSHGLISHYDVAMEFGASKEEARKIEEVAQKAKKEVEEKYADEQKRIDKIEDEKLKKQEQEKLDKQKAHEVAEAIRKSGVASQAVLDGVADTQEKALKSVANRADVDSAKKLTEADIKQLRKEAEGYGPRIAKGQASENEILKWKMVNLLDMKEEQREKYYSKNPGLREAVKECLVKTDDRQGNLLANALIKDKEVKREVKRDAKECADKKEENISKFTGDIGWGVPATASDLKANIIANRKNAEENDSSAPSRSNSMIS